MEKLIKIILLSVALINPPSYGRGLLWKNKPNIKKSDYMLCFDEACKTKYVSDGKDKDYWQVPLETRLRREGDCEDMSFDLYDRLEKIGIKNRVVIGEYKGADHAWVEFNHNGTTLLLDPACRSISIFGDNKDYTEISNWSCKAKKFIRNYESDPNFRDVEH